MSKEFLKDYNRAIKSINNTKYDFEELKGFDLKAIRLQCANNLSTLFFEIGKGYRNESSVEATNLQNELITKLTDRLVKQNMDLIDAKAKAMSIISTKTHMFTAPEVETLENNKLLDALFDFASEELMEKYDDKVSDLSVEDLSIDAKYTYENGFSKDSTIIENVDIELLNDYKKVEKIIESEGDYPLKDNDLFEIRKQCANNLSDLFFEVGKQYRGNEDVNGYIMAQDRLVKRLSECFKNRKMEEVDAKSMAHNFFGQKPYIFSNKDVTMLEEKNVLDVMFEFAKTELPKEVFDKKISSFKADGLSEKISSRYKNGETVEKIEEEKFKEQVIDGIKERVEENRINEINSHLVNIYDEDGKIENLEELKTLLDSAKYRNAQNHLLEIDKEIKAYENKISMLTILENNREAFMFQFGNEAPNAIDGSFDDMLKEAIARLAKGDKVSKLQNNVLYHTTGDYLNAAKFVCDIVPYYYPSFERPNDMEKFANEIKAKYDKIPLVELQINKEAKAFEKQLSDAQANLFSNEINSINNQKTFKSAYESIMSKIINKEVDVAAIDFVDRNIKDVAKAHKFVIAMLKNANKDYANYQINQDYFKKYCDNKLDGTIYANDMLDKFMKSDLRIDGKEDLQPEEVDLFNKRSDEVPQKDQDKYMQLRSKVLGYNYEKTSPLLKNALSTYARMKEIRSRRGFFFPLFHPYQNSAEKNAIKKMETVLKTKYGFTKDELSHIGANYANQSVDDINLSSLYEGDKQAYANTLSSNIARKELIDKVSGNVNFRGNEVQENDIDLLANNYKKWAKIGNVNVANNNAVVNENNKKESYVSSLAGILAKDNGYRENDSFENIKESFDKAKEKAISLYEPSMTDKDLLFQAKMYDSTIEANNMLQDGLDNSINKEEEINTNINKKDNDLVNEKDELDPPMNN